MNPEELKKRIKRFALRSMQVANALPKDTAGRILTGQLLRCTTSVGANYRSAARARSRADFISKIGVVEEEADESAYWLELVIEGELLPAERVEPLLKEAQELTAIFTASGRTARSRRS